MKLNKKKILLFITLIIFGTIGLQVYWNFKNFNSNKLRLKNEIQIAYDKALELYFNEESKNTLLNIFSNDSTVSTNDIINNFDFKKNIKTINDTVIKFQQRTLKNTKLEKIDIKNIKSITVLKGKKDIENINGIENFPNRITISIVQDSLNYKKLDSIFKIELNRKEISLKYCFEHYKNDSLIHKYKEENEKLPFKVTPKSSYFNPFERLNLKYNYTNTLLIKRMGSELILSLVFALAVIGCLFFLLHIIQRQKKIDEIKNDFISNITHEFKTPITTIGSALEGMSNFNPTNDAEKNKKYISISKNQLNKLETMVEKILETAALKTEKMNLLVEPIDLNVLLKTVQEKHQLLTDKKINLISNESEKIIEGDAFHLENAFSNLIDNAIKYGGNTITISINKVNDKITIDIKDNGKGINKKEEKAIFEKFYRIPKGNLHDVKGYGIGLFYSKSIIEKHQGTLELIQSTETIFRSVFYSVNSINEK